MSSIFLGSFGESNPEKQKRALKYVMDDVDFVTKSGGRPHSFRNVSSFTVQLKILSSFPEDFQRRLVKAIVDIDMRIDLQQQKIINWCRTAKCLLPLKVKGDGNCMLHAVSTLTWGFDDNTTFLRRLLYVTLVSESSMLFKKRWIVDRGYADACLPGQFQLDSVEWDHEWCSQVQLANDVGDYSRPNELRYKCLGRIHIFTVANILRRPIVVLCDKMLRSWDGTSMQPNDLAGVYLPLHWDPKECCQNPLVLAYHMNHFAPLVSSEESADMTNSLYAVPLVTSDLVQLRVHFLLPDEEKNVVQKLKSYMNVTEIVYSSRDAAAPILSAKLAFKPMPAEFNLVTDYFSDCENRYGLNTTRRQVINPPTECNFLVEEVQPIHFANEKCIKEGCTMKGSPASANMCSRCFRDFTVEYYNEQAARQGMLTVVATPTAPAPSINTAAELAKEYVTLSIIGEHCQTPGCKFQCSRLTFPFCHDCTDKKAKKTNTSICVNNENFASPGGFEVNFLGNEPVPPAVGHACTTPGCQNPGNIDQAMKCGECYVKESSSPHKMQLQTPLGYTEPLPQDNEQTTLHILTNAPPLPSSHFRDAKYYQRCRSPTCTAIGLPNLDGYCAQSYVKNVRKQNSQNEDPTCVQIKDPEMLHTHANEGALSAPNPDKQLCSKPGCMGKRLHNPHELCWQCLERMPKSSDTSQGTSYPESQLIESRPPESVVPTPVLITSMSQQIECASPMCSNMIFPPDKLCNKCLIKVSRDVHHAAFANSTLVPCKTTGCTYYGTAERGGYCSACSKSRRAMKSTFAPIKIEQPLMRNNSAPTFRTKSQETVNQMRPQSSPIAANGIRCRTAGCQLFGDPAHNDLCSQCFNQSNLLTVQTVIPFPVTIGMPQSTISQSTNPQISEDEKFQIAMKRVEGQICRTKCKNLTCMNYGNPRNEGYCSGCHVTYLRQKALTYHGEDVVDN